MLANEKLLRFIRRYGVPTRTWENRPFLSRRHFFNLAGAGVLGSFISPRAQAQSAVRIDSLNVKTINRAKNTIFILLTGAPSHTDTFDFKMVNGVTPASFAPETINGVVMPKGLLPKLTDRLGDYAIIRSMRSWALVHTLAQTWTQIGRSPLAALGDIAPNIGALVAIEKEPERRAGQVFPTFLGLNSQTAAGSGYMPATFGPFKVVPATTGLRNTANADGQARLNERLSLLDTLDGGLRTNSPIGKPLSDYGEFYNAARGLTYNPVVDTAFRYTAAESAAYGGTGFGNACLVAQKVLKADQGTRYIQISLGGWDNHTNIYDDAVLPSLARVLDNGVSQLIMDLKASGLYDSTLLVIAGEFGRTVGRLSAAQGRDHYLQQFCVMGGAGIKGGRALGATDETGARTTIPAWSRDRDVRPEDIEATILSAMGINWTSIRYDDPFNRGFEYVPSAQQDIYGPLNELWA